MAAVVTLVSGIILSSSGLRAVETDAVLRDSERIVAAVEVRASELETFTTDWAWWDDTYAFVRNANEEYVRANLMPSTFTTMGLSFIGFYDRAGRPVWRSGYDFEADEMVPTPPGTESSVAFGISDAEESSTGVMRVGGVNISVAALPILTSANEGPSQGTLVMARPFGEESLAELTDTVLVSDLRMSDAAIPAEADRQHLGEGVVVAAELHGASATGFVRFPVVGTSDPLVLTFAEPRRLTDAAAKTLQRLLLIGIGTALASITAVALLVDRRVLRRLAAISTSIRDMAATGDIAERVVVDGHDELSSVAEEVNALLDRVEESNRELNAAVVAAQRANRAKSQFLANMSHELRTPMNAILGMSTFARETDDPVERADMLRIVEQSARTLLSVLEDVLDLSKVEAGHLALQASPFDAAACIQAVVGLLHPSARQAGLYLHSEIAANVPTWVVGDEVRFRQIAVNLTANALKFTEAGGVTIRLALVGECTAEAGEHVDVRLEVEDTGIGIAKAQQERIFEAFTQVDETPARAYGGTGLGLAISSRLASLMGGTIGVESEGPGRGATFRVELPFVVCETPAVASTPRGRSLPEGLRVLVVEDNPVNRKVATRMLAGLGCEVEAVEDGSEAVAVHHDGWDVILMDVQMPGMDGYEATRRIRDAEGSTSRHTPIVAVTAHAMRGDRETCLAAGMDGYVAKPFDSQSLEGAIIEALAAVDVPVPSD
ncbi:MAG: response regulator [Acidimicrobiia bacterium]|nr:response regulator [Acidimicrobiia bacterium]